MLFSQELNYFDDLRIEPASRFECASVAGPLEAVKAGVGIGFLHNYVAAAHGGLVRVLPETSVTRSYRLLSDDNVKDLARVRAACDRVVEEAAAAGDLRETIAARSACLPHRSVYNKVHALFSEVDFR